MPRNELTNLISGRLGNYRRRSDILHQLALPGLSIDNVANTPDSGSGGGSAMGGSGSSVGDQVANLSRQLNELRVAQQTQVDKLVENTQALMQNTVTKSAGSSSSTGNAVASAASGLLGGGLGFLPLFREIFDLFGGSRPATPQPLIPFNLPPSIQYAGGTTSEGTVVPVDNGQSGQLRSVNGVAKGNTQATPNVQITVNAMDSRSFLDHSDDIAKAVRQAMLQSNSLNDLISDY